MKETLARINIRYAIARLLNMAVRPAALTAIAYFFGKGSADSLSLIIFSVAIGMMFMSIDPYRAYYKRFFNGYPAGNDFIIYIIVITGWGLLVSLAIVGSLVVQHVPPLISILGMLMFIGEKLADELLRFRLFERDLEGWSNLVIRRSTMQLAGLGLCIMLRGWGLSFDLFLLIFTLTWTAAFIEPINQIGRIVLRHLPLFFSFKMLRGARLRLVASGMLMLSSFMSAAPSYFDRMITILVDKSSLPLFLIASMSFAIISNFVDFFFVSKIRLNLLKNDIHLRQIILNPSLWLCILAGTTGGTIIIITEKLILGHIYNFDYNVLILIAAINVMLSLIAIPQQIVYWRDGPRGILTVETPFICLIAAVFILRWGHLWTLFGALSVIMGGIALRLILYLLKARGISSGSNGSAAKAS